LKGVQSTTDFDFGFGFSTVVHTVRPIEPKPVDCGRCGEIVVAMAEMTLSGWA